MATPIQIMGDQDNIKVKVSEFGQLITAPIDYSTPVAAELTTTGLVYNLVEPLSGKSIVITEIAAASDNGVSNNVPANIELFQADGNDSGTVIEYLWRPQLLRGDHDNMTGLNWIIPPNRWINARTDDDNVLLTIAYYRVPI